MKEEWKEFNEGLWCNSINVADFIKCNYTPYEDDESFLEKATDKTIKVWNKCSDLLKEELKKGVLDIDTDHMSGINNFAPGYICEDDNVIVGLQTDKPLKRMINPYGKEDEWYNELKSWLIDMKFFTICNKELHLSKRGKAFFKKLERECLEIEKTFSHYNKVRC